MQISRDAALKAKPSPTVSQVALGPVGWNNVKIAGREVRTPAVVDRTRVPHRVLLIVEHGLEVHRAHLERPDEPRDLSQARICNLVGVPILKKDGIDRGFAPMTPLNKLPDGRCRDGGGLVHTDVSEFATGARLHRSRQDLQVGVCDGT